MKKDKSWGYLGKIGNAPQQYVEAPMKPSGIGVKPTVIKGEDLRANKSKG